jgi:hypothetical protein
MLGDQIYLAALVELAGKTPVGKTWVLDRSKAMLDLDITDAAFEDLQHQIEARMTGQWGRRRGPPASSTSTCGSDDPQATSIRQDRVAGSSLVYLGKSVSHLSASACHQLLPGRIHRRELRD